MKLLDIRVIHLGEFPASEFQKFLTQENISCEILKSKSFFNSFFRKKYKVLLLDHSKLAPYYFFDGCPEKWILHFPKVDKFVEPFYFRNFSNIVFSEEDKNYLSQYCSIKPLLIFDAFCKEINFVKKIKETLPLSVCYFDGSLEGLLSQLDLSKINLSLEPKKKALEKTDVVILDSSHTVFDCLKFFSKGKVCIIINNKTLLPLIKNYKNAIYLSDSFYLKDVIKDLLHSVQKFESISKEAIETAKQYKMSVFYRQLINSLSLNEREYPLLKDLESSSNFG